MQARARKLARPGRGATRGPERFGALAEDVWADPGKRGEKLIVSEFPTFALGRLTGIVRRSFMPAYVEPFGIGIPEWRVMAAIASRPPLSFNEICGTITMDRAQVSRTLGTLLVKGLAAQITTARAERRGRGHNRTQTKLVLTPEGRRMYARILPIAQRHQMVLLSALDRQERTILRNALRKMLAAAEAFEARRAGKSRRPKRKAVAAGRPSFSASNDQQRQAHAE